MYRVLRKLLFALDPETAHHLAIGALRTMPAFARPIVRRAVGRVPERARVRALGLSFPSPVGLAAGFDKNAVVYDALDALGFGFIEVGTVTGYGQPGNARPRMFRLPADEALINRMGFNNDGADAVRARVCRPRNAVLGINIGKTKRVSADSAANDYEKSARLLGPHADYMVINVSSPNTPGLRDLQATEKLLPIVQRVRAALDDACPLRRVPLLVKISPDLANDDVESVASLAVEEQLDGIIATNTTTLRSGLNTPRDTVEACGRGGLSGRPLKERSLEVTRTLRRQLLRHGAAKEIVLVAVGGIDCAADAYAHLRAGATLVQAYTGFIYRGPRFAARVAREMVALAAQDGFADLEAAIGADDPPASTIASAAYN